jgi:hypothetical protein
MTAAECYARAIGLAPDSAEAYECMGTLLTLTLTLTCPGLYPKGRASRGARIYTRCA